MAALDMYAEQEQWEKCLEVAAKQVSACVSPQETDMGPGWLKQDQQERVGRTKQSFLGGVRGSLQQLKKHLLTVPMLPNQA